jgi:hypothetical protein
MPRVSQFYGIIYTYHNDHLPAHFHAKYGEHEAIYAIDTLEILRGKLPRRSHAMVAAWATLHRQELRDNWGLARQWLPVVEIEPLD